MDTGLAGTVLGDLNPLKRLLELGHLKWVRQIKASSINDIHELVDALGNSYILRIMTATRPKEKMWQDLYRHRLPYTSKVIQIFRDEDKCFVLEEKLPGIPLSRCAYRTIDFSYRDILRIGVDLAKDLSVLYRREGILHLDIKPENILIDDYGNGRLIDFGAAVTAIDRTNMISTLQMGTPRYMSPERYTDPNRIGPSSDLYSLALTLKYAMVKWEVTHFPLWQLLTEWSDPQWLEQITSSNEENGYMAFIQDLESILTT